MLNGFGDAAAIEKLREDMAKKYGVKVEYNGADMSKPAEIADLVAKTKAAFGSVDILVNNAGIQYVAPIEQFPAEKWDAIIAINLSATFHAIHAALPLMKASKWGRIVNIASTHGLVASAQKVAYVAAKHGIVGLTKVVGMECADTGVTCNAICPGWVLTPLVQKQIEARAKEQGIPAEQARRRPAGREAAAAPVHDDRADRGAGPVPRLGHRVQHAGHAARLRRRLDRSIRRPRGRRQVPQARHAGAACGPASRPGHRRARGADLPDDVVRVPRRRPRREPVQPRGRRPHLQPHLQPDRGGVRGAGRGAGGGLGRARRVERAGGAAHRHRHPDGRGRPHRRLDLALWRHAQHAGAHPAALRHRDDLRQSARP